jgi:hypothetical protein
MQAPDLAAIDVFPDLARAENWRERIAQIESLCAAGPRMRSVMQQRFAIELMIERLRKRPQRTLSTAETRIAELAAALVREIDTMPASGRTRFQARLSTALSSDQTLISVFHLMRTAIMQRNRGFDVAFGGLQDNAPFDLLVTRDRMEAEIICDVVSADEGRGVHRSAWFRLADRIDPDLQTWLAAHPGRYLLKMTLPQGLREDGLCENGESDNSLATLHERIRTMLASQRRADYDEAAVLRLDPLLLAAAQAEERPLLSSLRQEFGSEAHLSVTASGGGVFVMAARTGRENDIAAAVCRRMSALAPTRLTGSRPGILAMFVEDTDRLEWREIRDRLELEGEARQFLTAPEAASVVAVTCASRMEMFGLQPPDAAEEGELRFRNPSHPAAKAAALAPAVASSA